MVSNRTVFKVGQPGSFVNLAFSGVVKIIGICCDHCKKDHLLAFFCKGRWFCPSCHQKKVQLFGALVTETVLYPGVSMRYSS